MVFSVIIIDTFTLIILLNSREDLVAVHDAFVDVEDHITVHETSSVASTVDVATFEAPVDIIGSTITCSACCQFSRTGHILARCFIVGVPLQIRLFAVSTNSVDGGKLTAVGC